MIKKVSSILLSLAMLAGTAVELPVLTAHAETDYPYSLFLKEDIYPSVLASPIVRKQLKTFRSRQKRLQMMAVSVPTSSDCQILPTWPMRIPSRAPYQALYLHQLR